MFAPLASCIPHHHKIKLIDLEYERGRLKDVISSFSPDIVATTGDTVDVKRAKQVLEEAKKIKRDVLCVIGGSHATIQPSDFFEEFVDVVVIGYGEITFKELVESYSKKEDFKNIKGIAFREKGGNFFTCEPRDIEENLDELPFPDRDLIEKYKVKGRRLYPTRSSIQTSRGCPFRCKFCAIWRINKGKYSTWSPEYIVKELKNIKHRTVYVVDDNFFCRCKKGRKNS
jgi:radical SAM superfamily enzyme YgiQ (UPF0313 family)